jgi:putative Holliday junction resolvase
MRTLGLDVGERRIGVAVSDPDGRMAFPLVTHERRGGDDAAALLDVARREEAGRIVVGLPLSLDGTHGPQAEEAAQFAERLKRTGDLEVVLWDERLSSLEADHHLRAAGKRGKDAKARRDAIAASIILQSYLDSRRDGALPPLPPIE